MGLIDVIMTEILDKNLLGEIRYLCVSSKTKAILINDFNEEFAAEYDEMGRKPNKADLEDYFRLKILIDEHLDGDQEYQLLTKN